MIHTHTHTHKTMKVCIVGGGLAGLAYAISAAKVFREGKAAIDRRAKDNYTCHADGDGDDDIIEIVVLEKRDFSNRGATFGLAKNGQASMEEFAPELLDELKKIGIFMPETGGYMLPWYCVRDGLLERARLDSSVNIISNATVTSIEEITVNDGHDDKVAVTFKRQATETSPTTTTTTATSSESSSETMYFDYVVASDGVHSFVREILGAPPAVSSGTVCWRGAVHEIPDDLTHLVEGPIGKFYSYDDGIFAIFNFHKSIKNFLSWVATSKDLSMMSIDESVDRFSSESDRNDIRRLLEVSNPQELTFRALLCTIPMNDTVGWGGKGRVTLIGDAAHALRPASGLGGSLAFEDVVLLSRCLKSKTADQIPVALREFESLRFTRCKTIVDDQTRLAEVGYTKNKISKKLEWTQEYREWVFTGPDVNPVPPPNMYIDGDSSE